MFSPENPWIREREAALCTWKFDMNRGYVGNTSVSLLNDFMCLSDRQLRDYARMIKACGFTGIQVMDICAAWRASRERLSRNRTQFHGLVLGRGILMPRVDRT